MAERRHACADGLTPECFEKFPQYAKKVFAYRLMHTLCPARMTRKLRDSLWRALTRVPVSWIPFEYFIFPPDFDWSLIFPEDWTPGDPIPDGVIVEPDAEFPEDWTPGDPLPDGVTIDLPLILPPYWETQDPLPLGITVDPEFRIQIPQLKLMYIFIEPGRTWEEVFPNGWDPNTPLPDGASWTPYYTLPAMDPAGEQSVEPLTPEQLQKAVYARTGTRPPRRPLTAAQMRRGFAAQYGTEAPLYMGPWEPGPAHRPLGGVVEAEPWFYDAFDSIDPTVWDTWKWGTGALSIVNGWLRLFASVDWDGAGLLRNVYPVWPSNFDVEIKLNYQSGANYVYFEGLTGTHQVAIGWDPPNQIWLKDYPSGEKYYTVAWNKGDAYTWLLEFRNGYGNLYRDGQKVISNHHFREYTPGYASPTFEAYGVIDALIDYILITEVS